MRSESITQLCFPMHSFSFPSFRASIPHGLYVFFTKSSKYWCPNIFDLNTPYVSCGLAIFLVPQLIWSLIIGPHWSTLCLQLASQQTAASTTRAHRTRRSA